MSCRFVAEMTRRSTWTVSLPPSLVKERSSRTRRSFAWEETGTSATSSRKRVPPSACSIFPALRRSAPVNAPFSYPKSSAAQSRVQGTVQDPALQVPVLLLEGTEPEDLRQQKEKLLHGKGLRQVILGTALHRRDGRFDAAVPGHHDHRTRRGPSPGLP